MKIHRFIGLYDFSGNEIEITDLETVKQIKNVLRMEAGETIILSNGKGMEAEVSIESIRSKSILGTVISQKELPKAVREVSLYLAILKKENFELAVQKATECGVSKIIPVTTERTVKTGLNIERMNKIIKEAAEQCGQNFLPEILPAMQFSEALAHGQNAEEKILFHLVDSEYAPDKNAGSVSIFVGPEGGFTPHEIKLAESFGYTPASLGELTLRGETAAIVATYRAVQKI